MPYQRFNLDLAIPLDVDGKLPPIFYKTLKEVLTSTQLQTLANTELIEVIKIMIRRLKEYSVRISQGTDREEITVRAVHHLCKHDIGESCGAEEDI